jgi:flavin-dependent dehydrogenase
LFKGIDQPLNLKGEAAMSSLLEDGSRIGVIGGGPAGSLFAYFALLFAERLDLDLRVDIYESRDFNKPGLDGCNKCGGVVSESLIQAMALEGINLPSNVVQRGIDSYILHTKDSNVRLDTPRMEKRIAAVHRGGGPTEGCRVAWGGLDGYLLDLARQKGAMVVRTGVDKVGWYGGRPQVYWDQSTHIYDLLVGATGVNSAGRQIFEDLGFPQKPPKTTQAYITELDLGQEATSKYFSSSVHVFLLDLPHLNVASVIPKGGFVTVCLLGQGVDQGLIDAFFQTDAVRQCFPDTWRLGESICQCSPKINIGGVTRPFMDRVVLIGDCGVTRLYKDGIGTAYRTAKAAARTAVFGGVSAKDFEKHYLPVCSKITRDNRFGSLLFALVNLIKHLAPVLRGTMAMAAREQTTPGTPWPMSTVLWDLFTGSASYREVFFRTMEPRFVGRLIWESARSIGHGRKRREEG